MGFQDLFTRKEPTPPIQEFEQGTDLYAKLEELQKAQERQQTDFSQALTQLTEAIAGLRTPVPSPAPEKIQPFEESFTEEQLSAMADDPRKLLAVVKHLAAQEAAATLIAQESRVKALAGEEATRVFQRDAAQAQFFQQYPELADHKEYVEYRLRSINIPPTTSPEERSKFVANLIRRELNLTTPVKPSRGGARGAAYIATPADQFEFDPDDFLNGVEHLIEQRTKKG